MYENKTPPKERFNKYANSTSEKKLITARREALGALETFEKTRCHGGLFASDQWLLKRLRSDDYRDELADAWKRTKS